MEEFERILAKAAWMVASKAVMWRRRAGLKAMSEGWVSRDAAGAVPEGAACGWLREELVEGVL